MSYARAVRKKSKYRTQEDEPGWNWKTMGNRKASAKVRRKHPSGRIGRSRKYPNPW